MPIVLDAHDPELAVKELCAQLTRVMVEDITKQIDTGEAEFVSPEDFADMMATGTGQAIATAFHVGRAWQDAFTEHQRIHNLEHGGGGGVNN